MQSAPLDQQDISIAQYKINLQREICVLPHRKHTVRQAHTHCSPECLLHHHIPDKEKLKILKTCLLHFRSAPSYLIPCNWGLFIWKTITSISTLMFSIHTCQQEIRHFCLQFNSTNILTTKVVKKMNRFHVNKDQYGNNRPLSHWIYLSFLLGVEQDFFLGMAISCSN